MIPPNTCVDLMLPEVRDTDLLRCFKYLVSNAISASQPLNRCEVSRRLRLIVTYSSNKNQLSAAFNFYRYCKITQLKLGRY